jgi:hypothetical protein
MMGVGYLQVIMFLFLQTQASRGNYYVYLGEAGELQIKVSIWGEIKSPGLYSIPDGTDLATLLSLAGGPSPDANLSCVKVIHCFPTPSVTTVNLKKFFKTGDRKDIPIMKPGDMVRISKTFYAKIKENIRHLTELTLILGVYLQLYTLWKVK